MVIYYLTLTSVSIGFEFHSSGRTLSHRVHHIMSVLVTPTPPCKTHLSTADHSATPIGNSADPFSTQGTGMHVQQTTKYTKDDASTVRRLVTSSDPSTSMSSIASNSHIYRHDSYSLPKWHSLQLRWWMNTPNDVHIEDADVQPSTPGQQSDTQCFDSIMHNIANRQ